MRSLIAAGLVCVGLLAVAPSQANAQVFVGYPRYPVFYPPVVAYPGYVAPVPVYNYPVYSPPVVWRGHYSISPFRGGRFSYETYSPWTNTYRYQYRYFR